MKRCRHNAKVTRRWRQTIRYIFTLIFRNLGIHFIHWPISKFCRQQIHPKQLPPPEVRLDKCASSFARCNSNFHWCRMLHPEVYLLYHLFYSELDSGWVSRTGSHSELTNSIRVILLQRYRFFLSVPCLHEVFQFSLNFASRYICVLLSVTTQTFNHAAAWWRGGFDLKPGCISPNKMRILPCVISAMLWYRVRVQIPATC